MLSDAIEKTRFQDNELLHVNTRFGLLIIALFIIQSSLFRIAAVRESDGQLHDRDVFIPIYISGLFVNLGAFEIRMIQTAEGPFK